MLSSLTLTRTRALALTGAPEPERADVAPALLWRQEQQLRAMLPDYTVYRRGSCAAGLATLLRRIATTLRRVGKGPVPHLPRS